MPPRPEPASPGDRRRPRAAPGVVSVASALQRAILSSGCPDEPSFDIPPGKYRLVKFVRENLYPGASAKVEWVVSGELTAEYEPWSCYGGDGGAPDGGPGECTVDDVHAPGQFRHYRIKKAGAASYGGYSVTCTPAIIEWLAVDPDGEWRLRTVTPHDCRESGRLPFLCVQHGTYHFVGGDFNRSGVQADRDVRPRPA